MSFKLWTLLCISGITAAGRLVLHESRTAPPTGFVHKGAAHPSDMLTLRFGLTSNNIAGLQDKLLSISTPGNANFRQWLSSDEVKAFVEPSSATVSAFSAFASANGLKPTVISPHGDWVSLSLPVSKANQLFGARFELFSHPQLIAPITRTLSVSLPSELVGHVDVIHPATDFSDPNPRLAPATSFNFDKRQNSTCNTAVSSGTITPTCLQELYGIPTTPATQPNNTLLVTGYVGQFAQTADLRSFLQLVRSDIPATTTFTLLTLDGGTNPQGAANAGVEANLDIQYTTGTATNVPIEFLSVGRSNSDFLTSLLDTTTFLAGVSNPPTVMTTSYGTTESSVTSSTATKICNGYMALGARGISVLFASGDGGVRGNHDTTSVCRNNNFMPVFPASCPFITSVGSTIGFSPEKAINFTGGGFSNVFSAPSYQTTAVNNFLKTVPTSFAGTFNRAGRGYPDVAVQGWNFEIVSGGVTGKVGGTSASSPTFAGIIALINDRLLAAGKPVLGFLNPFIYGTAASTFTDITIGHNSGDVCPATSVAFDAAVGWDPLTGFGTPNFDALLSAALSA